MRGYIAMLATRKDYRGHGIATSLVKMAIEKMISEDADEVSTFASPYTVPLAHSNKHTDRSRDRSRQHPITTHLRESGLHPHKAIASILPQRQHGIPTYLVLEARHPVEANVPSRLPYAHVRSCSHARSWLDGRGLDRKTSCSDADRGCVWRAIRHNEGSEERRFLIAGVGFQISQARIEVTTNIPVSDGIERIETYQSRTLVRVNC